jgi:hypothetical protein
VIGSRLSKIERRVKFSAQFSAQDFQIFVH